MDPLNRQDINMNLANQDVENTTSRKKPKSANWTLAKEEKLAEA